MKAGLEEFGVGGIYLGYHGNSLYQQWERDCTKGTKGKQEVLRVTITWADFFWEEVFRFRRTQGRTSFHVCTILREGYFNLVNSSDRIKSNPSSLIPGALISNSLHIPSLLTPS